MDAHTLCFHEWCESFEFVSSSGKQIIHPGQIDIVNKAFSPSEEKISWATELVAAFEEQERVGKVRDQSVVVVVVVSIP